MAVPPVIFYFLFCGGRGLEQCYVGFFRSSTIVCGGQFGVFGFNERLDRDFLGFLFFKPNIYDGLRDDKLGEGIRRIQINKKLVMNINK